jgi:hypothetical protein
MTLEELLTELGVEDVGDCGPSGPELEMAIVIEAEFDKEYARFRPTRIRFDHRGGQIIVETEEAQL